MASICMVSITAKKLIFQTYVLCKVNDTKMDKKIIRNDIVKKDLAPSSYFFGLLKQTMFWTINVMLNVCLRKSSKSNLDILKIEKASTLNCFYFQVCGSDCQPGESLAALDSVHTHPPLPSGLGSTKSDNSGSNHSQSSSAHFKPYLSVHQSKNNSVPATILGGLANSGGASALGNNNSCGGNINNFSSIVLSSQIQKSQSPTSVPAQGGMSPTPGRPRDQLPQQHSPLQQPQQQQPSFAGVGGKPDVPTGGSGAKRPRKGSGGALPLKLQTSQVPVNNIDNVRPVFISAKLHFKQHY